MPIGSGRATPCGLVSLILACVPALGACRDRAQDGAQALNAFRTYVASTFTEKTSGSTCDLRTDVRATQGVAEPWEGLLHADIFVLEKNGERNPYGWTVDAVFDRTGSNWTCSPTRSKSANDAMKPCETLQRFCVKRAPPPERPDPSPVRPSTATLYPDGWQDLPPYGEALFEQATGTWRCEFVSAETNGVRWKSCELCRDALQFGCASLSFAVATKTGKRVDRIDKEPTTSLTFAPAKETSYTDAVNALQKTSRRPPDATRTSNEEGGKHRNACWRNGGSNTTIESGWPIAKGSIVTVTAHEVDRCLASRD